MVPPINAENGRHAWDVGLLKLQGTIFDHKLWCLLLMRKMDAMHGMWVS